MEGRPCVTDSNIAFNVVLRWLHTFWIAFDMRSTNSVSCKCLLCTGSAPDFRKSLMSLEDGRSSRTLPTSDEMRGFFDLALLSPADRRSDEGSATSSLADDAATLNAAQNLFMFGMGMDTINDSNSGVYKFQIWSWKRLQEFKLKTEFELGTKTRTLGNRWSHLENVTCRCGRIKTR